MSKDIRIAVSLRGHPKRAKLEMLIGPGAAGHLLDLWISTAMSHPDGVLRGLDDLDVAIMANWRGQPQDLTAALIAVRFMGKLDDGTYYLHDWAEHQAWVVGSGKRSEQSRSAANVRHHGRPDGHDKGQPKDAQGAATAGHVALIMPEVGQKNGENMHSACTRHADGMPGACGQHAGRNAPLPSSSSTLQEGIKTPPESTIVLSAPAGGSATQGKPRTTFQKPTLDEVAAYCAERKNSLDPQAFIDHYTSNGWRVGKNPMRDWRAAVRTWERSDIGRGAPNGVGTGAAARLKAMRGEGAQ